MTKPTPRTLLTGVASAAIVLTLAGMPAHAAEDFTAHLQRIDIQSVARVAR